MSRFKQYGTKLRASVENQTDEIQSPDSVELTPDERMMDELSRITMAAPTMVSVEGYFTTNGARLMLSLKEGFGSLTTWTFPMMDPLNPTLMYHATRDLKYTDLVDDQTPQPPGLNTDMMAYLKALCVAAEAPMNIIQKVLEPAQRRFGHYLTVPDERGDKRDFVFGADIDDFNGRKVFQDNMSKVLSPDNVNGVAPFGDLYPSLKDFVECERYMSELTGMALKATPAKVKRAVEAMQQSATSLIQRLQRSDNMASNEFIEMVSRELEGVANQVSYYSLVMAKIIEVNNILALTEKQLRAKL